LILSKKSVFIILISVLISNTAGMAVYTYISRYLLFLEVNFSIIPVIVSIFALTSVIFPPFLGKYSDKLQNRYLFIFIGAIGMFLTFLLLIFTQNLFFIIIFLFMYGFFSASFGLIFVLYAELVENDEKYITYYTASISFGWFLGAILAGIYVENFGIENITKFFLVVSFFTIITAIFIRENRPLILERFNAQKQEATDDFSIIFDDESPISESIYLSLYFRNFGIRPILSVLAIIMAFHIASDSEIGLLIGINPLIQFFLMILIGQIITEKNLKWFMIIGYLLSAIVIFGFIISVDFFSFLFYQILISFSFSLFWTATQVYIANNTTPENKGKYMGYANTSFYLGSFMGSIFFSLLLVIYADYYVAMIFMIIFPALSAIIIFLKFDEKKRNIKSKKL